MKTDTIKVKTENLNPDPITGEPGSHPLGTGLGAAGGAAAGAAIGAVGGPVGVAVGGVIGAVAGGLAGHSVAEGIDPTVQNTYWRENHMKETYYDPEYAYPDYEPAYRVGYQSFATGRTFEETEFELAREWDKSKGDSRLDWTKARPAARAGWHRVKSLREALSDGSRE